MKYSFLLAASLSFSLVSCGGSSGKSAESPTPQSSAISVQSSSVISANSSSSTSVASSSSLTNSISSSTSSQSPVSESLASISISSSSSSQGSSAPQPETTLSSSSSSKISSSTSTNSSANASTASSSSTSSIVTSSLLYEPFTADKTTLFSASYKAVSTDSTIALNYITGGGTGITQADGQLTIVGGRFSIGNRTPTVSTTSAAVNGDLDLSKPYVIRLKIIAASGTGSFQVYVDNNTTSAGNSPLGNASKVFSQVANTLTANQWLEITPVLASANSFIALRTESSTSVTIDEIVVEYLSNSNTSATASSSRSSSSVIANASSSLTSSTMNSSSSSSITSSTSVSSSNSSVVIIQNPNVSADCIKLATDPTVNWRDTALQTDQQIIECLSSTLGHAVGYGEKARGGYDANGDSHLVIITKNSSVMPEQQVLNAISTEQHKWIVFDKKDYANGGDLAMYRLYCTNTSVLTALNNATTAECLDHNLWCSNHGVSSASCSSTFFNTRLNNASLPIRNEMIKSNTTIDGRGSSARFLFNGFKIGSDYEGTSTYKAENVILTHLLFEGAGHVEDHLLDPDMIRSTGESHDIWIHKNTFKNTGDSAFDVKVGAYAITMSFNRLEDVLRASLHGSSDSHTINTQTRTTMHNNFFITTDGFYNGPYAGNNTARRVPLLRAGSAHLYNNVFYNYRKNFASVRVGGTLFLENNIFLGGTVIQKEKSSLPAAFAEWLSYLTKDDFDGGYFSSVNGLAIFSDDKCKINSAYQGEITATIGGSARDLKTDYSQTSRDIISSTRFPAGQDLVDYTNATAGREGQLPFNSPLAVDRATIIGQGKATCL